MALIGDSSQMSKPETRTSPESLGTELFRVLEVLPKDEKSTFPLVMAGSLATKGIIKWFDDTPVVRQTELPRALDAGNKVEKVTIRDGRELLLISEVEALPNGNKIVIDGTKPVMGIDGEQMPAVELLIPGDVIELAQIDDEVAIRLVGLADEVPLLQSRGSDGLI